MESYVEIVDVISDETKYGVVTCVDDKFNYVWNNKFGPFELKFPLNPAVQFKRGEWVRFVQSHALRGVQVVHNLMKSSEQPLNIVELPNSELRFKIEVLVSFAPQNSRLYEGVMGNDNEDLVKAVGWAENFNLVVSYFEDLEYEEGAVYKAWISRVTPKQIRFGQRIGTIFGVVGKNMGKFKVTDKETIRDFLKKCPWNKDSQPGQDSEEDSLGLPTTMEVDQYQQGTSQQIRNQNEPENRLYEVEPLADNYTEAIHLALEGEESLGIIVRCEAEYSVIWNPKYDLVRIPIGDGDKMRQDPHNAPIWPLQAWVYFRCMEEQSQLRGGVHCRYTAYDIKKTTSSRETTIIRNGEFQSVAVRMTIKNGRPHSTQFFYSDADFFGKVFCSYKDRKLRERMTEGSNMKADVYAIYTEQYKFSKWVVFAMWDEAREDYVMVEGLPPFIEGEVTNFFQKPRSNYVEQQQMMDVGTSRFKPPTGWYGPKVEDNGEKIVDVLGVVVGREEDDDDNTVSVIATRYGLARQPTVLKLGIWVRATIIVDHTPLREDQNYMEGLASYVVMKSKKIAPPISTRAVKVNGTEKLLLCCNVRPNPEKPNELVNDYLGSVTDIDNVLSQQGSSTNPTTVPPEGHLMELGLARDPNYAYMRFWKILKDHGDYNPNVNKVALKLSHFNTDLGRTCDDAHSILIDQEFDFEKWKKNGRSNRNIVPQQQPRLPAVPDVDEDFSPPVPVRSTRARVMEASASSEQQRATSQFSASLPYQPKQPSMENPFQQQPTPPTAAANATMGSQHGRSAAIHFVDEDSTFQNDSVGNLDAYQPKKEQPKRAIGIVVGKTADYAIVYSGMNGYGDAIVLRRMCESREEFERLFQLSARVGVGYVHVKDAERKHLEYELLCVPPFKTDLKPKFVDVRVVLDQFVQARVRCDFRKTNIKKCDENEAGSKYCIVTEMGNVLLNTEVVDKSGLLGKVANIWVTHMKKRHGCNWQIVLAQMNRFEGDEFVLDDIEILEDRLPGEPRFWVDLQQTEQQPQQPIASQTASRANEMPRRFSSSASSESSFQFVEVRRQLGKSEGTGTNSASTAQVSNGGAARVVNVNPLERNGYGDFLFGGRNVPDVISGERYASERNRPRNMEMDATDEGDEDHEAGFFSSSQDESAESFNSNHTFSSEEPGQFSAQLRAIGGASPLPCNRRNRNAFSPSPSPPPRAGRQVVQKQPQPTRNTGCGGRQQTSNWGVAYVQHQQPPMSPPESEKQKPMDEPLLMDLMDFGPSENLMQMRDETAARNEVVKKKSPEKKLPPPHSFMDMGGPSSSSTAAAQNVINAFMETKKPAAPKKRMPFYELLAGEQSNDGQTGGAKVEPRKMKHLLSHFWDDEI